MARIGWRDPRLRIEREAEPHRGIARDQKQVLAPEEPWTARPAARRGALQWQRVADHVVEPLLENLREARALLGIREPALEWIDVGGESSLFPHVVKRVLTAGHEPLVAHAEVLAQAPGKRVRLGDGAARGFGDIGEQRRILPDRLAIAPPERGKRPARELLARIPFALTVVNEATRAVVIPQALDQRFGELALARAHRGGVPLRAVHVVDGDEGGLAAHREAHVAGPQRRIDLLAEGVDLGPLRLGVGKRHARGLEHARDGHFESEFHLALVNPARDWRGARRLGRAREREVPCAGQQPGRGIEADPACARQVDFAPGVQIREVLLRARRAVEGFLVRLELYQISGYESRGQAAVAEGLHEEPARVAAGAGRLRQRLLRRLHAGLEADDVADELVYPAVQRDEEIDRALLLPVDGRDKRRQRGHRREVILAPVGLELDGLRGIVRKGKLLGSRLQEEIERVVHRHLRHQVDLDRELPRRLRENQPREVVALRILLPVHEVRLRLDPQRVTQDRRPAMRRRSQPHDLGPQPDQPVVGIGSLVVEGDVDGHERSFTEDSSGLAKPGPRPGLGAIPECGRSNT